MHAGIGPIEAVIFLVMGVGYTMAIVAVVRYLFGSKGGPAAGAPSTPHPQLKCCPGCREQLAAQVW